MKRYCQILTFPDDAQAIEAYIEVHSRVWPEIKEGIRSVGILERLAALPRQAEWEAYVAQFQGCDPAAPSTEKWQLMEQIFKL